MKRLLAYCLFMLIVRTVGASQVSTQLNAIISQFYYRDSDITKFQAILDQNEDEVSGIEWGAKPFTPEKLQKFFGDFRVQSAVDYISVTSSGNKMAQAFEGYNRYALKAIFDNSTRTQEGKLEDLKKMYMSATYYARRSIKRALSALPRTTINEQFKNALAGMEESIIKINGIVTDIIKSRNAGGQAESGEVRTQKLLDFFKERSPEERGIILNNLLDKADLISKGTLEDDPIRSACNALLDPAQNLLSPVEKTVFRNNLRFVLKNRIQEVGQASSDEDLKNAPEDIFNLLTGQLFDGEFLDPKEMTNPTVKAVVQGVRMRGLLVLEKMPQKEELQDLENTLKSSQLFEKYPKVWLAMATSLTDRISQQANFSRFPTSLKARRAQINRIQKLLEKTVSGREGSVGKRMIRWFKDHCNFARLRLNIMSRLSYRNNESRYAAVNDLVDGFNRDQSEKQAIAPDEVARRAAIESIARQVGVMLQGLNEKDKVAGQPEGLLSKLSALDPEGKIIYTEVIRGLNANVRREFVTALSRVQSGEWKPIDANGEDIVVGADGVRGEGSVFAGLRAAPVSGPKEPAKGKLTVKGSSAGQKGSGVSGGTRRPSTELNREKEIEMEERQRGQQGATGKKPAGIQETSFMGVEARR